MKSLLEASPGYLNVVVIFAGFLRGSDLFLVLLELVLDFEVWGVSFGKLGDNLGVVMVNDDADDRHGRCLPEAVSGYISCAIRGGDSDDIALLVRWLLPVRNCRFRLLKESCKIQK